MKLLKILLGAVVGLVVGSILNDVFTSDREAGAVIQIVGMVWFAWMFSRTRPSSVKPAAPDPKSFRVK